MKINFLQILHEHYVNIKWIKLEKTLAEFVRMW